MGLLRSRRSAAQSARFVTPRNNPNRRKAAIQKSSVATLTIYNVLL
jgi:hypothetical protein